MFIRKIIDIVGNSKKSFAWYTFLVYDLEFTTPCWSATSSLLHLNQFRGGGARPPCPPTSIRQCRMTHYSKGLIVENTMYYILKLKCYEVVLIIAIEILFFNVFSSNILIIFFSKSLWSAHVNKDKCDLG